MNRRALLMAGTALMTAGPVLALAVRAGESNPGVRAESFGGGSTGTPARPDDWTAFAADFAAGTDRSFQPRVRWWWPGASVDTCELRRQIKELADAGFGGVEISDVYDTVQAPMDPRVYGSGTDRWNAAVAETLNAAAQSGLKVDLTVGPAWPPSGTTACNPSPPDTALLLRVLVAECATSCAETPTVTLKAGSTRDITDRVTAGS